MNIHIKTKNIELIDPLQDYIYKRLSGIEKFLKNPDTVVYIEVSKTTVHHKNGDVYKAEIMVGAGDSKAFAIAETDDIYKSIDDAKEELVRTLTSTKDRNRTLLRRGALSVKKMMKGLSKRNPFTSKY